MASDTRPDFNIKKEFMNPWAVTSIYQFQFYCCPDCLIQVSRKQDFVDHVYDSHSESVEYLKAISDDSLSEIICPWNSEIVNFVIKSELEISKDNLETKESATFSIINDDFQGICQHRFEISVIVQV